MKRFFLITLFAGLLATSLYADTTWTDSKTGIRWTYSYPFGDSYGCMLESVSSSSPITGDLIVPSSFPYGSTSTHSLRGIDNLAFENMTQVTSITIKSQMRSILSGAFKGCESLTAINITGYQDYYSSVEGFVSDPQKTEIIIAPSGLTTAIIPEGVTTIGVGAFTHCSKLSTVVFSKSVTSIKRNAFKACSALTSLRIPANVSSVAEGAFSDIPKIESVYCEGSASGWSYEAFGVDETLTAVQRVYCEPEFEDEWLTYFTRAGLSPEFCITVSRIDVLSTVNAGGTLSFRNKDVAWGNTVQVTATPNDGYIFLGWGSNVEGIEGVEQTLTFTVPEQPVTLIANFFPKAVLATLVNETLNATLDEKVDARIEAKIDGESLLTAEQAATKTSATIEAKVADGELITSEQLQVMAMEAPVIAVADGVAKVGVSLKRAESLNGEWTQVEAEEAEITEDGDISVSVPADEKAAFYKFVVPNQQ